METRRRERWKDTMTKDEGIRGSKKSKKDLACEKSFNFRKIQSEQQWKEQWRCSHSWVQFLCRQRRHAICSGLRLTTFGRLIEYVIQETNCFLNGKNVLKQMEWERTSSDIMKIELSYTDNSIRIKFKSVASYGNVVCVK
jgi:hypothetical protein